MLRAVQDMSWEWALIQIADGVAIPVQSLQKDIQQRDALQGSCRNPLSLAYEALCNQARAVLKGAGCMLGSQIKFACMISNSVRSLIRKSCSLYVVCCCLAYYVNELAPD